MKKQISLWMTVILLFGTVVTFAQKPFAGTITFETLAEGTDDPNIAAQLAELTQEVIVMGNNTRTNMSQPGIDVISISNGDYNLKTTVIDIPGYGKYYIEQDAEKLKKAFETVKFDYKYTDETKTIAGYNCKKVNVTTTDLESDEEHTVVLWVTEDLMTGENINFGDYPGLKGYAMRTEVKRQVEGNEITIIVQASSVKPDKKVKATTFLRPSDAMPIEDAPEDLKKMLGMGGDDEE